ncbi:MAG TPA: hypothetical protein VLA87_13150 [Gaiellaceae bacterium]|nr:hypothetical protein [Gaiellaceae bacterium]
MRFRHVFVLAAILTASAAAVPSAGAATAEGSELAETALFDCTVASTSNCDPGTKIVRRNRAFHCTRPLSRWGRLPLKVKVKFSKGRRFRRAGAIDLDTGCAGDGDPNTIDLIVKVKGNGRTHGPGVDAFKVRQRAGYDAGIQVTGDVDCGPRYSRHVHQDGVQLQGGRDITFVDFTVGRYRRGKSTCQGAGGALFYSGASGYTPQNIDVVRGKYIACNHALLAGLGSGSVVGAKFRSGRVDGTDRRCRGFSSAPPCELRSPGVSTSGITCERWDRRRNRWVSSPPS